MVALPVNDNRVNRSVEESVSSCLRSPVRYIMIESLNNLEICPFSSFRQFDGEGMNDKLKQLCRNRNVVLQ